MSIKTNDLLVIPQEILIALVHGLAVNGFDIVNYGGVIYILRNEKVIHEYTCWAQAEAFLDGYMTAKAE